jgi:hypothetical protein
MKSKVTKIKVLNLNPDQISTGYNTKVLVNGEPVMATSITIHASASEATRVILELIADVEVDLGNVETTISKGIKAPSQNETIAQDAIIDED